MSDKPVIGNIKQLTYDPKPMPTPVSVYELGAAGTAIVEEELKRAIAALAAEKTAHGSTWERLVNVENVAYVMAEMLRNRQYGTTHYEGCEADHPDCAVLTAYDKFRTATKPEEAE